MTPPSARADALRAIAGAGGSSPIYTDALAFYCVFLERWKKAEQKVREKTRSSTTNSNIIQNPYSSIANRALEQMNKLGAEFGMTPSSRSRV